MLCSGLRPGASAARRMGASGQLWTTRIATLRSPAFTPYLRKQSGAGALACRPIRAKSSTMRAASWSGSVDAATSSVPAPPSWMPCSLTTIIVVVRTVERASSNHKCWLVTFLDAVVAMVTSCWRFKKFSGKCARLHCRRGITSCSSPSSHRCKWPPSRMNNMTRSTQVKRTPPPRQPAAERTMPALSGKRPTAPTPPAAPRVAHPAQKSHVVSAGAQTQTALPRGEKKIQRSPLSRMTIEAASRLYRDAAIKGDGSVPAGSFAARAMRAAMRTMNQEKK